MTLHEYLHVFREAIDKIDRYGYAESVTLHQEIRAGKQALLQVTVVLVDASSLHIKEYVDAMYGIEKLSYGYQYQDAHGDVIFRYDNATHKPSLNRKEHKHTRNRIIEISPPDIADLVDEVISYL
jgi:hypothetical protein